MNLVQLSTSHDGGLHWGAPATTPDGTCVIGGQPVVQPNGTLIMPIDDCFETSLLSIRSTDGGQTLSQPSFISEELFFGPGGNLRSGDLPSAAIDASGRVYVTFVDCRLENRCTTGIDDMMISSSDDGVSWSVPKRIPIALPGSTTEVMLPGLGVDPGTSGNNANLGLVYYFYPNGVIGNNFCGVNTCQLGVGFISSTNGGRTWSSPRTLAGPMNLTWLPLTTQGFMVGDYFATSVLHDTGGASDAFPMFMVASQPTPPDTTCSNVKTGAPGDHCNQPTFTIGGAVGVGGGNNDGALGAIASGQPGPFSIDMPERVGLRRVRTVN